ncbi:MAG TPA: hypothetical protein VN700_14395 [Vicinamibacterales bacterium]|nr:hypothetical protein [Vicinamibacterales bacterium]
MAKALDRAMAGHERAVRDGFWLELFEALERACKLQLAICPSSDAHTEESSLSEVRRSLKRMYEHLSHGVAFDDFEQVACAQLAIAARAWIKGEAPAYMFDPESITAGGLQEWHERYNITVDLPYPPSIIKAIEDFRQGVHGHVAELFEEWRAHPRKDFDYWIAREREAGRNGILGSVRLYQKSLADRSSLDVYESSGLTRFMVIVREFQGSGVARATLFDEIGKFLQSPEFQTYPYSRIETAMWAGVACQAANGRKTPPNVGMQNDITVVAALMPYCDAMLVDNECRELLRSIPKKHALGYKAEVFSPNSGEHFLTYLRGLEATADPGVLASVREVYGADWPRPFLTMYEVDRQRDQRRESRTSDA